MYKLEFLPIAKKDIENIVYYISNNLKNTSAARKLSKDLIFIYEQSKELGNIEETLVRKSA